MSRVAAEGILFVCQGNVCRSPMAQVVSATALAKQGLAGRYFTDSCGTAAFNAGKPIDPRARAALAARGYPGTPHRARQICDADFRRHRLIVAMDRTNLQVLHGWLPADFPGELRLLLHFATGSGAREVADPFYATQDAFRETLRLIEEGVAGLLRHLDGDTHLQGGAGANPRLD